MFTISLFFKIALIINISLYLLTIKTSALRSKLLNIKMRSFLPLNVFKLKINMIISLSNVYELIMITNIKILISIFIITIKISRENQLILNFLNEMKSSNDSIKRFSTSLTLLLKTLILIKNID